MTKSFLFLAAAGILMSGCSRETVQAGTVTEPPAVIAPVLTVAPEALEISTPVTGTLVSRVHVEVKAEVMGRITRFDKEEGARVAAGEQVASVDDENYRLALKQAETAVMVANAALERARLLESHSRAELDRAANLLKSGGITDKDLKLAQLADHDARAQVSLAAAQVEQARAAREVAGKHMRDTGIRAPVAGEIQKKFVNKGAYVEMPTPVFTVVDNTRLELESPVASSEIASVKAGQRVKFTVNTYPGAVFEGRVVEIAPAVDELTRSAKVRVQVANAGGRLKAGMFAQGEILTGVNAAALVIPASAVYRDDRSAKASYVFVVANGKAARRAVRIGHEMDSRLEIAEGLRPGDKVIAGQNIEVAEGVRIEEAR